MELITRSPYPGDTQSYQVVARMCGFNGCRASTPCRLHDQVIVRFNVDGVELPNEAKLSKQSFNQLLEMDRDPQVLFHHLAEAALLANEPPVKRPIADAFGAAALL